MGPTLECDDFDECTADGCDEIEGCFHDPISQCPINIPASDNGSRLLLTVMFLSVGVLTLAGNRAPVRGWWFPVRG